MQWYTIVGIYFFGMFLFASVFTILGEYEDVHKETEAKILWTILYPIYLIAMFGYVIVKYYHKYVLVPLQTKYKVKRWKKKSDAEYKRNQRHG